MAITAFCVRCKEKGVPVDNPVIHTTAKGGKMAKGTCSKCKETTVCAMLSKDAAAAAIASGEATEETQKAA